MPAELPTDSSGNSVTKIEGDKISLAFPQPSDINGPLRYVKIRKNMAFLQLIKKIVSLSSKYAGSEGLSMTC